MTGPSWEDKGSSMDFLVVVFVDLVVLLGRERSERNSGVSIGILGANHETNLARGIGRDSGESVLNSGEDRLASLLEVLDDAQVKPDALCLGSDDTLFGKSLVKELEVRLLEERLGRTFWIRRVGDDTVKGILVLGKKLETVTNVNSDTFVFKALLHLLEVQLGDFGNHGVNVAKNGGFNSLVLKDFTKNTTVTTTNDEDLLRVGVRIESKMSDHFLVRKLVSFSGLDNTIQNKNVAVVSGFENENVLILGLGSVEDLLNSKSHSLTGPHGIRNFTEPSVFDRRVSKFGRHFWKGRISD